MRFEVSGLDHDGGVVELVLQNKPDMVLLDIQLGDMDGRDICRELKHESATREIPIIMISANHSWDALHEKQCHADDFLAKPFDVNELVDHVKRFAA